MKLSQKSWDSDSPCTRGAHSNGNVLCVVVLYSLGILLQVAVFSCCTDCAVY